MPQNHIKFLAAHLPKNSMELTLKNSNSSDELSTDLFNENDIMKVLSIV